MITARDRIIAALEHRVDHSVPSTVSFESYCHAMDMVNKHGQYQ